MTELKDTIKKLLHVYAFAHATQTTNINNIHDLKMSGVKSEGSLVELHYRMVDKSSIFTSQTHSSKQFKIYFDDALKEVGIHKSS